MGLVQILGATLVVTGLFLFFIQQVRGQSTDKSEMQAWKINLSGPPALVLIAFGSAVFLFPFSPWWPPPDDPNPPATTTTEALTTTTASIGSTSTTGGGFTLDTAFGGNLEEFEDIPDFSLPLTPAGPDIWYDSQCGGESIEWFQNDDVLGWYISVETIDNTWEIDTALDPLFYGNDSILCYWDFGSDPSPPYYWIWIYGYNGMGYSEEPLFIEYLP
jgi:hypothetical protein